MFSKQPAFSPSMAATGAKHTPFSLIGGDVIVTGNISASVDLHIDGRVEGDIGCANLVQGPDSVVKGNITAKTARIAGTVEGSITAEELIVERTAKIFGDSLYGALTIENGAQVDGRLTSRAGQAAGAAAANGGTPDLKVVSNGE